MLDHNILVHTNCIKKIHEVDAGRKHRLTDGLLISFSIESFFFIRQSKTKLKMEYTDVYMCCDFMYKIQFC